MCLICMNFCVYWKTKCVIAESTGAGAVLDRSRTTLRPFVDLVSSRVQQCRYLGAETREVGTGPKEEVI